MSGSIWKRELSLRRKRQEDALLQPAPEPASESVVDRIDAYVPEPADAPALPPTTGDYGWLTEDFDPSEIPAEMPAVSAPPVSIPVPEPSLPAAVVAPAPAPDPEPVAPDSPASQPIEKKPFWKQELTLKRRAKEPKTVKQPKAKKPTEPKDPMPERQEAEATEKKPPIWKRDLSLGKPKKARATEEPHAKKEAPAKKVRQKKQKPARGGASKSAIVGLKIGASQVAAACVSNGSAPQLLQIARLPLPDGVVVGGELRDIDALAEALTALFAKNKLPKKGVRLGIANGRIGVRTFEISGIDDPQQLGNAIRFRAQETLPIPLEEAVLDWQLLSESTDAETGQTTRRVLLVVAYRELVDRYVAACRKAGIRVAGIDLEAFAMLRALGAPPSPDAPAANGAQVVVNVGHDRSTFAVSDGRVCEFTRVLSWGGQSLSVAIAHALDLTPSEAQPIKHALSLVAQSTEPPDGVTHESLAVAREAALRELQSFARELVSSLRFYQNQPGSLGIGELVLTGGTAHLPGLPDELSRLIGVPVRVGDPLNRVAIPKKFREPECALGSLTVAIGLGIED